jgi:hypothetical protein
MKEEKMTSKRQIIGIVLALVVATPAAFGHEGHEHKILGTVTMAAADHVMLQTTGGKETTVKVTADTKVTKDEQPVKIEDVKAGTRIVVTAVGDKEPYTAKAIEIGEAPKSTKNK